MSSIILQEDYTYLADENGESLLLELNLTGTNNNYEFVGSSVGNTGILSFSERIR